MKDFLKRVVYALVDYPDQVTITETQGQGTIIFGIRCHPTDVGKLVGKKGRTIQAVRIITLAAGGKQGERIHVDIIEDQPRAAFAPYPRAASDDRLLASRTWSPGTPV
jgi:predicted RNA-binding protein YlqC (UPF0109 family)